MQTNLQKLLSLLIERKVHLNLINDTMEVCQGSETAIDSLIRFIEENNPTKEQLLDELVQVANHNILGKLNKILINQSPITLL